LAESDSWKTGGGPTWLTGSYDVETNTLYWGVGNPGSWQAEQHPGDNLWTDCMLALDPDTGKIKWGYQYTPNDAWDYDGMATPILVDTTIDGKATKAAVVANRNGYFYAIDRSNGKFIYAFPTVEDINWTTGLDPKTGRPTINEAMKPKSGGGQVQPIVPGLEGGTNWFPPAYDPELGLFFVAVNQWGMGLTAWEKGKLQYKPGDLFMGVDYQMYRMGETIGHIKAIDIASKKVVWDVPSPLPFFSGMLATKGGVLFTGDQRGRFWPTMPRPARNSGSSRPAPASTPRRSPTSWMASSTWPSCRGLGGDPASTTRRRRAACSGSSRSTARSTRAAPTTPRLSRRCCRSSSNSGGTEARTRARCSVVAD
jgi:alcohol dehydrogenase (cytochrome c)